MRRSIHRGDLHMLRRLLTLLVLLVTSGCGSAAFRDSQDWSAATDPRLFHTCQVTDWGSGVWLAQGDEGAYVLTCAHVLEGATKVDVFIVNPETRRYERFRAEVVLVSHIHKEDLALLRLDRNPPFAAPFKTRLASPLSRTEPRKVQLMNVSFGAEQQPFVLTFPLLAVKATVSSYLPDDEGKTEWALDKGLLHGGIREANSGSPVFEGEGLVGLVEMSPFFGSSEANPHELISGISISLPETVSEFLLKGGYLARCVDATDAPAAPPADRRGDETAQPNVDPSKNR